ncbi:MAG: xanthine dehydrogenase accessory protein XdhC [Burkholderiales bacterium]|nr:xanthine dehydrogenase accessory protein XdhC [Burkholderiales bacterium]
MNLQAAALFWQAEGRAAIVVEVSGHQGSVPRETGTRMLVGAREVLGTIGGGHLEWKAVEHARALLAGADLALEQRWPLGPALGQCCGGMVSLRYQALAASRPAEWDAPAPRFALQLYGAGHVGRAIVRLLEGIACRVQWIDEREEAFPAAPSAAHVERIHAEPVEAEVASAAPGDFYLVLTHSHDLDWRISAEILRRGDFGFLGLIGSKTKRARFRHRFEARGIDESVLARMTCPIGLPGIVGKEPEVIAVSVVAQLLAASGEVRAEAPDSRQAVVAG